MILKETDGLIKRRLKVIALAPVFAACIPVGAAIGLLRPLIYAIRFVAAASKAAAAKTSSATRKAWRGMFIGPNDSTALVRFKLACLILPAGSAFCARALFRALIEVTRGVKEAWNHTPRGW